MSIEIKEYVGHEFVQVPKTDTSCINNLTESEVQTYIDENSLMVDIEAIHSKITRNNTYYSPECLKESVPLWTHPYERPVIYHHKEKDGVIIGRVKAAQYKESNTRGNTPALLLTANIGDEQGKKGIKNGTLSTVSIGVIVHDLRCSICGHNLAEEGLCEHEKGEYYNGELCYWIINKMEPKEISYVIVPSDSYAHNIRVYDAIKKNKSEVTEKLESNPFVELATSIQKSLSESTETEESKFVEEEIKKENNEETSMESEKAEDNKEKESQEKESQEEENKENSTEETETVKQEETTQEEDSEKVKELENKIKDLEKDNESLKQQVKSLNDKFDNEKKLRESAETELLTYRVNEKKNLIESVNTLRKELNLVEENVDTLMESNKETLELTVKQLKEFKQAQTSALKLNIIESPIAVNDENDNTAKENKKTNVKEFSSKSNKSLEEQILETIRHIW